MLHVWNAFAVTSQNPAGVDLWDDRPLGWERQFGVERAQFTHTAVETDPSLHVESFIDRAEEDERLQAA